MGVGGGGPVGVGVGGFVRVHGLLGQEDGVQEFPGFGVELTMQGPPGAGGVAVQVQAGFVVGASGAGLVLGGQQGVEQQGEAAGQQARLAALREVHQGRFQGSNLGGGSGEELFEFAAELGVGGVVGWGAPGVFGEQGGDAVDAHPVQDRIRGEVVDEPVSAVQEHPGFADGGGDSGGRRRGQPPADELGPGGGHRLQPAGQGHLLAAHPGDGLGGDPRVGGGGGVQLIQLPGLHIGQRPRAQGPELFPDGQQQPGAFQCDRARQVGGFLLGQPRHDRHQLGVQRTRRQRTRHGRTRHHTHPPNTRTYVRVYRAEAPGARQFRRIRAAGLVLDLVTDPT